MKNIGLRQFICLIAIGFVPTLFVSNLWAQSAGRDVEEVVIGAEYIPDEKLATSEVADILDAESMSIAGDGDLGGALKRVPGLSLVGGKYIYVRGLGERYSATYFNGTLMPSPEPLQRAVPLDMFDTSITKNVLVQKTHSADFGLEFSGGVVDIRSAAIPEESFFKIKVSSNHNAISTGKNGLTSIGGDDDWLGKDDGSRALPSAIGNYINEYPFIFEPNGDVGSPEQDIARLSFTNNDWEARNAKNPYDYGISIGGGRRFQLNDRVNVGFITVSSLSNKWRNRKTESTSYEVGDARNNLALLTNNVEAMRQEAIYRQTGDFTLAGGSVVNIENIGLTGADSEERTQRTIKSTNLLALGMVLDNQHIVDFTNLLARKSVDSIAKTSETSLFDGDYLRKMSIDWVENEIDFKQLSAQHLLDFATIKWRYALVEASRDNLDSKQTSFRSNSFGDPFDLQTTNTQPSRAFSFLDDETTDSGFDIELPFASNRGFVTEVKLKLGFSKTEQKRDFRGLQFNYILRNLVASQTDPVLGLPVSVLLDSSACVVGTDPSPVTVDSNCFLASNFAGDSDQSPPVGAITLSDGSASGLDDRYNGKANFEAQYINLDMQLLDTLRFNLGTRRERSLIEVRDSSGQLFRNGPDEPESKKLRTDQLTSFSITWDFYPNMIFRAAYSETLNRPILREIAPVRLFNPGDGRFYVGNPSLVTAEIENFDLRYEMYFGENDYFSLSAFKKNIDQPIETFARETTEEIFAFGWQNSAFAVNEGLEFEVRKYMTPSFYLTANATFIDSKVVDESDLKNSLERSGITERSLTGVSEELINTQFVYDRGGFQGSLSYNRYSERVFGLILSPTGSTTSLVVEQPFTSVDANVKYSLDTKEGVIKVGVKVANLLDEPIVRTVKNLGDLPYETYDVGQTYGLSIEWKH